MKYWLTLFVLLPMNLSALTAEDELHIAAHAGATYAITHGTKVVCTKVIGKEYKLTCALTGVVLANTINIGRKALQGWPNDTNRATISGIVGSGLALTFIMIDW